MPVSLPNVRFEHPDLLKHKAQYVMIEDCIAGQEQVKYRRQLYLPMPNAGDQSIENRARYTAYVTRASFYNVTKRTVAGLVGMVFDTPPTMVTPDILKPVIMDASGGGINLEQLAKRAVRYAVAEGRLGCFVDFPQAPEEGMTVEQAKEIQPNITIYNVLEVINWRVQEVDGHDRLTLVVLHERYVVSDDGFQQVFKDQYRVLRLVRDTLTNKMRYIAQIWRSNNMMGFSVFQEFNNITDFSGNPLEEIPFMFIGAEDNDAEVDDPPMYDIAALNIAHYRNSADYEESVFIVGQPTPWFSGMSEEWVKDVWPDGKVELGSRAAVALPENGAAGLLQAAANTMPFEAMTQKEEQMTAIGARLIRTATVERTATDAVIESSGEASVITDVAKNVSAGITWALRTALKFLKAGDVGEKEIVFELNTDFGLEDLPPDEIAQIVAAWVAGSISWTELRERFRQGKLATQTDTVAKAEIEADKAKNAAAEITKSNQIADGAAKAQADHPKPTAGPTGTRTK